MRVETLSEKMLGSAENWTKIKEMSSKITKDKEGDAK